MRHIAGRLLLVPLTVLLGVLLAAALARVAPGFGEAARPPRASQRSLRAFYTDSLAGPLHGDLGVSLSLRRPVSELLAERIPVTVRGVGLGLACGWFLALSLAGPAALSRAPFFDRFALALSGVALCLPSALLALLMLLAGGPAPLAIGFVVFPRVFLRTRNLLIETRDLPHVLMARARGAAPARILVRHVTAPAASQLLALAGVSVSMALGAAIPVEVLSNIQGAGQLVWLAALGRDLPLLVTLTALAMAANLIANSLSGFAVARPGDI